VSAYRLAIEVDAAGLTDERPVQELPESLRSLPVCPRGMLQGDDGPPLSADDGRRLRADRCYALDLAWDGFLVDDPEHPSRARCQAALAVVGGGGSATRASVDAL
jgi:hypothetical protein